MNVLLIGMNFGNYEKQIVNYLQSEGHQVFYMYDTDKHYTFFRRFFGTKIATYISKAYQEKKIKQMKYSFDKVIVIVGRNLTSQFLYKIKEKNPKAYFILYLWDDVKRVENYNEQKKFYDEIYSFDLKDCKDYDFKHLPLFFTKCSTKKCKKNLDIYSAMFLHSDREKIINDIAEQAKSMNLNYRFYLSLGHFLFLKRYKEIKENKNKNIIFIHKPISESENYRNMNNTKIILDVQFSSQIGLTMRTIESLGMKNKLITTNKSIKYYDFYNPKNISIIDRDYPVLDISFINEPYVELDTTLYDKYSLSSWVKTLLGEQQLNNYIGCNLIKNLEF